jgi:hypothetical protein
VYDRNLGKQDFGGVSYATQLSLSMSDVDFSYNAGCLLLVYVEPTEEKIICRRNRMLYCRVTVACLVLKKLKGLH